MRPRRIRPGVTYFITRRCLERRFLLRPSRQTNQVVEYCLAVAARRAGVQIHAFVAMSNHVHLVVTDTEGRLPEFLHQFHRNVAIALNAALRRSENFWAVGSTSVLELEDSADVLDKMAYVVANPTIAGLVEEPEQWPGSLMSAQSETRHLARPSGYFRARGPMPEEVSLSCVLPPQLERIDPSRANEMFREVLTSKLRAAHRAIRSTGSRFIGPRRVMKMGTSRHASSRETHGGRNPRFAIRDRMKRGKALAGLRAFWLAYREAFARWREGQRHVRFPEGTWMMTRVHGARCEPPHLAPV